jgi:hypothetical protein
MSTFNVNFTNCAKLNKKGKDLTQRMLIKELKSKKQALQLKQEGWCKLNSKTLATYENPEVRDKTLVEFKRIREGIKKKGTDGERDTSKGLGGKDTKKGWWDDTKGWVVNNPGTTTGIGVGAAAAVVLAIFGIKKLKGGATQYRFSQDEQGEKLEVLKVKKDKKTNTDKITVAATIRGTSLEIFKIIKQGPSPISTMNHVVAIKMGVDQSDPIAVTGLAQTVKNSIKELSDAKLVSRYKENREYKYIVRKGVTEYTPPVAPAAQQPATLAPGQMTYVRKMDETGQNVIQIVVKLNGNPIAVKMGDKEKHTFDQWQIQALEAASSGPTPIDQILTAIWPIAKQYGYEDQHHDGFKVQLRSTLEPFQVDDNMYHFNAVDEAKLASQAPQPEAPQAKTPAPMPQPAPAPQSIPEPQSTEAAKPVAAPPPRPGAQPATPQPAPQKSAPKQPAAQQPAPPPRPGSAVPPPRKSSSTAPTVAERVPAPAPQATPPASRTAAPTQVERQQATSEPQAAPPPRQTAAPAVTPTSTPTKPGAFKISLPPGLGMGLETGVDPVGPTEMIDANALEEGQFEGIRTQEMETVPPDTESVVSADTGAPVTFEAPAVDSREIVLGISMDGFRGLVNEVVDANLMGNASSASMLPYETLVDTDQGATYGQVLQALQADIFAGGYGLDATSAKNMAQHWAIKELGPGQTSDYFVDLVEKITGERPELEEGEGSPLDLWGRAEAWIEHGFEDVIALPLIAHLGEFVISATESEENQASAQEAFSKRLTDLFRGDLEEAAAHLKSYKLDEIDVLSQDGNDAYLNFAEGLQDITLASIYFDMGKYQEAWPLLMSALDRFGVEGYETFRDYADNLATKIREIRESTPKGGGSGSTGGSGGIDPSTTIAENTAPNDPGIQQSKAVQASASFYVDPNAAKIMAGVDPVELGAVGVTSDSSVQKPLLKTNASTAGISVAVIGNEVSGGAIVNPIAGATQSRAPQSISLFNSPTRPMALPLVKVTN